MTERPRGAAAYARQIERAWCSALERAVVLSPKEWALISDWHARGIPLALVLEILREAAASRPTRRPPRSLTFVAAAVAEAWEVVLDGRRRETPPCSAAQAGEPTERWRARRRAEPRGSPLSELLAELLEAYAAGEPADRVEARLEQDLPGCVGAEFLEHSRREVDAELAGFERRMDPATLERTRDAAVVASLRRRLDLPALPARTLDRSSPDGLLE